MTTERLKAAQAGLKRYQDKPCKRCGETWKYTSSGACVVCTERSSGKRDKRIRELLKAGGA